MLNGKAAWWLASAQWDAERAENVEEGFFRQGGLSPASHDVAGGEQHCLICVSQGTGAALWASPRPSAPRAGPEWPPRWSLRTVSPAPAAAPAPRVWTSLLRRWRSARALAVAHHWRDWGNTGVSGRRLLGWGRGCSGHTGVGVPAAYETVGAARRAPENFTSEYPCTVRSS